MSSNPERADGRDGEPEARFRFATNDKDRFMDGIAAIAIHQAAAASALGVGSLPAIPLNVAEAFAAGALLSGLCVLPVIAPRRARQRNARPSAARRRDAVPAVRTRRPPARSRPDGPRSRERHDPPARATQSAKCEAAGKRTGGRHAAPSVGVGVRMPGRRASRLAVRD